MAKHVGLVAIALLLLTGVALAQFSHYDVAVTVGPVFTKQSSGNGTVLTASTSGVLVATGRVRFSHRFALAGNFARTKNSQFYSVPPNDYRVQDVITEFGGAVVFSFLQTKKLEGFGFGGMSALIFTPKTTQINTVLTSLAVVRQTKPVPVYGLGFDYHVYHRFAVRLQYRGVFYKAPDFSFPNFFTGGYGHMAETTAGVVYKF